jgi:hypothetical protein
MQQSNDNKNQRFAIVWDAIGASHLASLMVP